MRFAILGPTEVWDGDRLVELGPARRRLVLAALLVDAGRVVPTEVLLDRVWDGRPAESSLGTLHTYISRLRSALGANGATARLVTSPRGYRLDLDDPDRDIDARRFSMLLTSATQQRDAGDQVRARAEVTEALELWRGPAYADFQADFVTLERARLHDLHLAAHELAAELDLALGHPADVVAALTPIVAAEPLRETLRAALVLALYRAGRQADALASYAEGRERLVEELGVDPGPMLQELHQQILRQDPGLDLAAGPPARSSDVPVVAAPATGSLPLPVSRDRLVGREEPLAHLTDRLASAATGRGDLIAVVGEAGIGKSRLVEEAATRARASGAVVVWGRCWQHEGAPAFWPWAQAIRELAMRLPEEILERALSGAGAAVTTLVPEIGSGRMDSLATLGSTEELETQVFDGVLAFLGAASSYRTIVVVLDDLQWADPASRRLTQHAAQRLREVPVVLVATIRSPGQDESHPDLEVLAELSRLTAVTRIDLPPLTAADVHALVAERTGDDIDDQAASDLQARTGGNPFYVGEIVRLVVANGAQQAMTEGVPDTVRGVIRTRVQQLPETDQRVLRTAAVVGRTFDLDLLASVTGLDEDDVDEAADRATSVGILRSEPGSSDQHRFTHALLQETLLDETGPSRRARLHRRIAETLIARHERAARPGLSERVAHHLLAAGAEPDLTAAVSWYLTASDEALDRRGWAESRALLETAETVVRRVPEAGARTLEPVVAGRLRSFQLVVDGVRSPTVSAGFHSPATAPGASERDVVTLLTARWGDAHARNDMAVAEQATAEMLRHAEEMDSDLLRIAGYLSRGLNHLERGRPREAGADFEAMAPLVPRVTIPPMVFVPHPAAGSAAWGAMAATLRGERELAAELYRTAVARAAELDEPPVHVLTLGVVISTLRRESGAVLEAIGEIETLTARQPMEIIETFVAMPHAWAVAAEDLDRGVAMADATTGWMDQVPEMTMRPWFRGLYADLLLRVGRLGQAADAVQSALSESARHGVPAFDAFLHEVRARVLLADGADPDQVLVEVDAGIALAEGQGAGLFLGFLKGLRAELA